MIQGVDMFNNNTISVSYYSYPESGNYHWVWKSNVWFMNLNCLWINKLASVKSYGVPKAGERKHCFLSINKYCFHIIGTLHFKHVTYTEI